MQVQIGQQVQATPLFGNDARTGGPLAVSPTGDILYISGISASVAFYDIKAQRVVAATQDQCFGCVTRALLVSADGSTLYQGITYDAGCPGCDNNSGDTEHNYPHINVIDARTAAIRKIIPVEVDALAVSPDGKTAYAASFLSQDISVVDLASGTVTATIPAYADVLTISSDGSLLYLGSNQITVVSTATHAPVANISLSDNVYVSSLALSLDGVSLYAALAPASGPVPNGSLVIVSTSTNEVAHVRSLAGAPLSLCLNPANGNLLVGLESGTYTGVIDISKNAVSHVIAFPVGFPSVSPIVSADGARLYLNSPQGSTAVYDTNSFKIEKFVPPPAGPDDFVLRAVTPDGKNLIGIGTSQDALIAFNTISGDIQMISGADIADVAVSPDGRFVYVACSQCKSGELHLTGVIKYDLGAQRSVAFGHFRVFGNLRLSPDGSRLYFPVESSPTSGVGLIEIVDTESLKSIAQSSLQVSGSFALSPDGATLWAIAYAASSGDHETLYEIDAATLTLINQIQVAPTAFAPIVTPDGKKVYFQTDNPAIYGFGIYDIEKQSQSFLPTYISTVGLVVPAP